MVGIQGHSYGTLDGHENVPDWEDTRSDDELRPEDHDDEDAASDVQRGVRDIEATTVAWTTGALVFAYVMIWLTYLVEGLLQATTGILTPYVTSDFARHALTPTVGILSSVVGGVTNLTLAKVLDVVGRPQGYLFCVVLATLGLVMMAVCRSVPAYAAAQVFQTVGNNGLLYSLTVFVADTSSLRTRGLIQAVASSPNVITSFLAGPMASRFLALDGRSGWRWAFAMFAVLVPATTLPLFQLLLSNYRKAQQLGLVGPRPGSASASASADTTNRHRRSILPSLVYYGHQFDALGLALLSAGVALVLLPLNLYTVQGWGSPLVAGLLLAGCALVLAFGLWERHYARSTFVPYSLLLDRTVAGACLLSATLFISYWCWNSFFSSYLQVVHNLTVENANYVVQSYTVCAVLCSMAVGTLIHYTGRFKPVCLYVGVPMSVLGSGLLMYVGRVEGTVGYVILCQILISIAAGTIMVCDEIAILAAASHQHVAVCLAVLGMFGNMSAAIGLTIASAIWQEVFPKKLADYLPAADLPNLDKIYADLSTQLSYPIGSDTRIAIQHAYGDAQTRMLAVGTAVWLLGLVAVLMWRDINVIGIKQNKGHVW